MKKYIAKVAVAFSFVVLFAAAYTFTQDVLILGDLELGNESDTTVSRVSAGLAAIEGDNIVDVGQTDTVTGTMIADDTIDGTELADTITLDAALNITGALTGFNDTTPDARVDIENATASQPGLIVQSTDDSATNPSIAVLNSSGSEVVALEASGAAVFNEQGNDADFRVEGDTDANLFFADASTDRVGIGTNLPDSKVEISGAGLQQVKITNTSGPELVFQAAASEGWFGTLTNHRFTLGSNATGRITLAAAGNVGVGNITDPQSTVDIRGAVGAAGILTLSTKETTVVDGDVLGQINFNAPKEADGTDAILVGASIWAEADATFDASTNTTDLVFATGTSEAAVERLRLTGGGGLTFADAIDITVNATTGSKFGTSTLQKIGFYNATPIVQPSEITDEETTITFTEPSTPDFALQDMTNVTPWGFADGDELRTFVGVVENLQVRVKELEDKLNSLGLLADAD